MKRLLFFIPIALLGCSHKPADYDAEAAGKDYCNCMIRNHSSDDYAYARLICDGELIQKYPYYKMERIDMNYEQSRKHARYDYVAMATFMNKLDSIKKENCCAVDDNCEIDTSKNN